MHLLNKEVLHFPDPAYWDTSTMDEPFCIGGDLSPERVLMAYRQGIFPWYNEGEVIQWWCPDPRFVLYPKDLIVSQSMRRVMQQSLFSFTENVAFEEVIKNCSKAKRKNQCGTWIHDEMIHTYLELHRLGVATSVEAWQNNELVGGFYGLDIGAVFCGESMFAKASNASKAAFIYFVQKYKEHYRLIDCQVPTAHLQSLGARSINKRKYLALLQANR